MIRKKGRALFFEAYGRLEPYAVHTATGYSVGVVIGKHGFLTYSLSGPGPEGPMTSRKELRELLPHMQGVEYITFREALASRKREARRARREKSLW